MNEIATNTEAEIDPVAHAEAVVRRSGSSFFWAMRRLPTEKRQAMYAIYAFCREVDDIADDPGEEETKRFQLGQWRGEVRRIFADNARLPTAKALIEPVDRYGLPQQDFNAMIDGMEMDAGNSVRIADMAELELYCDRVACSVGRMSNQVFGVEKELGDKVAFALGQALQLTNILRDVAEDAERDRLYLPQDLLTAHGIDSTDIEEVLTHPRLVDVCELLAEVAKRRFAESRELLAQCDRTQMRPAIMMMEVYNAILNRLFLRGWEYLDIPVKLSKVKKLWVAFRYGML
jgi:presqualene diphosphate synthase